ncbi:hypothetical protein MMC14_009586 [Varicellaria rhodocarpa]|nr:hypothetical protein [Varicellaria rhodocarpa]
MQRYDGDALQASNESGPLTLCIENIGQEREWIVARASDGDVTLRYHAVPEGGLQGTGTTIIPIPLNEDPPKELYRYIIEWDLIHAPVGTRTVSTLEDGPAPVEKTGLPDALTGLTFFVGPLKAYSPFEQEPG